MTYDSNADKRVKLLTKDVQESMRQVRLEEEEIIRKILQAPEIFSELGEDEREEVFEMILRHFEEKKEKIRRFKARATSKNHLTQVARNIQKELIEYENNPDRTDWMGFQKMLTLMAVNATVEELSPLSKKRRNQVFEMIEQYFWQEYRFWGI